ncbi:MAG: secondary thiamine-phosphate synthase enzyme YjbQ [Erythrobacter sp.]|nr:secondary thiamine-phosphate synthase enzyme YjbQ [Erythrobacter sp.]
MVEITREIAAWVERSGIAEGLLTVFCRHTSASLVIQENAAQAVRSDFLAWLEKVAPEGQHYDHDEEGPDDMPAHLKMALTGVSLAIPVIERRMALGTWQGVFLVEHRARPHTREIALHLSGDCSGG